MSKKTNKDSIAKETTPLERIQALARLLEKRGTIVEGRPEGMDLESYLIYRSGVVNRALFNIPPNGIHKANKTG